MNKLINLLLELSVNKKKLFLVILDTFLLTISLILSFVILSGEFNKSFFIIYFLSLLIFFLVFKYFEIYSSFIRFESLQSLVNYFKAIIFYSIFSFLFYLILNDKSISIFTPLVNGAFLFILVSFFRYLITNQISNLRGKNYYKNKSVIIYGAGKLGANILSIIRDRKYYKKIFFVDDDNQKIGRVLDGIKVFSFDDIDHLISNENVIEIIIAIPSNTNFIKNKITNEVVGKKVSIKIAPNLFEANYENISYSELKDLNSIDLISSKLNGNIKVNFKNSFNRETILITGGGGSIGSELSRQIAQSFNSKIYILDINEYNLYKIEDDINNLTKNTDKKNVDIKFILFDLKKHADLNDLIKDIKPTIIFHAAAYKHVPIVEDNALIGIENNFLTTVHLLDLAIKFDVNKFIFISTDKAVRPNNIMGVTKRLCEIYVKHISNKYNKNYSIVRFGNVVGSSGSVIPQFINQIKKGGPLTVTDPEVTRYFMTIPDAASLIINVNFISKGGEVFVLDMGKPIKILDIANHMKSLAYSISNGNYTKGEIDIIYTGLRKGEKMHEEVFFDENPIKTKNNKIFVSLEKNEKEIDIINTIIDVKSFLAKKKSRELKIYLRNLLK